MTSAIVQKQVNGYLPLLSSKQQILVLEMIKTLLNVESGEKELQKSNITRKLMTLCSAWIAEILLPIKMRSMSYPRGKIKALHYCLG